jgi:hypothetical protein
MTSREEKKQVMLAIATKIKILQARFKKWIRYQPQPGEELRHALLVTRIFIEGEKALHELRMIKNQPIKPDNFESGGIVFNAPGGTVDGTQELGTIILN